MVIGEKNNNESSAEFGVSGEEVINQVITGATSGATAVVIDSLVTQQGSNSVTELRLTSITGTFVDGETISGNSATRYFCYLYY